jgi:hypothetical protein
LIEVAPQPRVFAPLVAAPRLFVLSALLLVACGSSGSPRQVGGDDGDAGSGEAGEGGAGVGEGGSGGSVAGHGGGGSGGSVSPDAASSSEDASPGDDPDATSPPPGDAGGAADPDQPPACQHTIPVANMAALPAALTAAKPGDCLELADGTYGAVDLTAKATAEAPIQVRAANPLKATLTNLTFTNAAHVIVRGVSLSTVLFVNSNYCRLTRSQLKGPGSGYWVRVEEQRGCMSGCKNEPPGTSDHTRIDHNDIGGGSSSSDIFNPTGFATNSRIDHNYIHDTSGPHLMTLGCCGPKYDYFQSGTIIESNLFVNASGTSAEMISIKGAGVHFRYNTIRKHNGDVDIRAGRNNSIYGNFILGPGPGLRMYEDNHKIYNNYVVGGLSGSQSGPIHAPVKNATVVFNLFTGGVALAGGAGNVSANNVLLGGGGGGSNLGGAAEALGFMKMGDIYVIGMGSKAIGAAMGSYPFVTDDLFGHARGAKLDVGPEQFTSDPPLRNILTTADVGPMAP